MTNQVGCFILALTPAAYLLTIAIDLAMDTAKAAPAVLAERDSFFLTGAKPGGF
jgi:hypothetical protein